jgi:regulator of ribonuclease activity A
MRVVADFWLIPWFFHCSHLVGAYAGCKSHRLHLRFHFFLTAMNQSLTNTFSTCDFCDAHKADASGQFRVLPSVFKDYGGVVQFHGQVVTVKCYEDNSHVKKAVESAGLGRVLVVDGSASLRRALLGGNLAAAAVRNGWAGVVIDGCARDAAELAAQQVGIRALALNPMPTLRADQGMTDVPVFIQGIAVHPGDWLYADADGMVVSTQALHSIS